MEKTIEINEYKNEQRPSMMLAASETLLANLPIIVLGLSIFLVIARELIA